MPPLAVSLSAVPGWEAVTAQNVHTMWDRVQMPWIDTRRIPAEVVKHEPFRNVADQLFVAPPVSLDAATAHKESAVTVVATSAGPLPAVVRTLDDLGPETLSRCRPRLLFVGLFATEAST